MTDDQVICQAIAQIGSVVSGIALLIYLYMDGKRR
jgi:hypothetical protein